MRWTTANKQPTQQQSRQARRQRGAAMTELVVVLPALLLLGLGSIQSALFHQAKTTVTYATFEAARTGATTHALKAPMLDQFGLRMAPIFGGDGSGSDAVAAIAKGKTEARNATITRIDIINPSREAFQDFGVHNPDTGQLEIPNSHLRHRDANDIRANSGVNIQDANLLKIKTTYGYQLKVPLINGIVTAALKKIDPQNAAFYDQNRIPITAVATVRMHSAAWEDGNLTASGAPPGGGVVPNGESSEGVTPGGENDNLTDGQGSTTDPLLGNGNTCDSTTTSCIASGGNDLTNNPATQGNPNSCPKPGEDTASNQTANVTGLPATGTGNPIHVVSGNKYQLETDHPALPGPLGLVWQRHYNSQSDDRGELGTGWRHSYDVEVRPTADGFRVVQADGRHILFTQNNDDRYESTLSSDGWLTLTTDPTYGSEERLTWHWRNGQQLKFNPRGQLTDITSPSGAAVRLQYNDDRRLFLVRDAQNRELSLSYYLNGRLKTVLDTTGQPLRYRYDDRGNLESVTYPDNTTREYHYEDKHDPNNLTGITDQLGIRSATWAYDDQDRAISSEHADGVEKVSIAFNDDGTRLITNSLGEVSTYYTEQRRGLGLVTAIAGPGCSSCSMGDVQYDYDDQLNLVRSTDKDGKTTVRTYDAQGRTTGLSQVLPNGETRELARYDYADETSITPQRISKPSVNPDASHAFALNYNAAQQITDIVESGWSPAAHGGFEAVERHTQLAYEAGLLTRIDGPRDDVADITTLTYDTKKRLRTFTTPDGRTLRITAYDRYGRPTEIRQGKQQPVVMAYNHRGDVTEVTQRGQTLRYHYDAAGNLTQVTGPDGETLKLTYDEAGRATEVLGPDGRQIISELDSEGRTTGNQLLSGQGEVLTQLSYFYDAEGRLSQIQKNGETAQTREYDGDKVTSIADAQGNTTGFDYSSLGELLAITQPDGNATRLAYDAKQNLSAITDARNNQTQYRYNDFGQLIEQHNPDTGTTRYAYDAGGNQTEKTDADGNTTRYQYDAANRVTQRHDNDGTTRYHYDATTGRLSKVSDATTTETFAYNRDAQLIEHTRQIDTFSFTTTYAYTTQGKLVRKALPDGQLLKYHYHEDGPKKGTLRAITRDDLIGQTTIIGELNTHDTATQAHWQHGNGVAVNKQTDGLGNPVAYSFSKALNLTYSYDDAGRISGIERNGQPNWYDYDASGQLIGADTSLGRFEYDYDAVGNRTQKTSTKNGQTEQTNYAFAESGTGNRLLNVNGEARDYNAQGNPTETERLRYEYNAQQRPIKVYEKHSNKLIAEYAYNSFGARIKKVTYSSNAKKRKTVTYYLYDGRKLAAEVNEDGKITAQYVYYKDQPVAKLQRRDIYAIHADHLGTPLSVTDAKQNVVWQAEYTPFGEATLEQEAITLNLRLPGQYYDEETGTHYNYYRDYDPGTGRYQQSDPIGLLGGLNTYAYVTNNPLQLTDILGLAPGDDVLAGPEPAPPSAEIADYSFRDRLKRVLEASADHLARKGKEEAKNFVQEMLQPENLAIMAGSMIALAGVQAVPGLNAVVDGALAIYIYWNFGKAAVGFLTDLTKVGIGIFNASSPCNLDTLGVELGDAITDLVAAGFDVADRRGLFDKLGSFTKSNRIKEDIDSNKRPDAEIRPLANGYKRNPDGTVTGPKGGNYKETDAKTQDGNPIFKDDSGNYYDLTKTGKDRHVLSPYDSPDIAARKIWHNQKVDEVAEELEAQGYKVRKEISFKTPESCPAGNKGACRPDLVYFDESTGTFHAVEVKTGNAKLSNNQESIFPNIGDGTAVPTGKSAKNLFGISDEDAGKSLNELGIKFGGEPEIRRFEAPAPPMKSDLRG